MSSSNVLHKGSDDFGTFRLREGKVCQACGQRGVAVIYRPKYLELEKEVLEAPSLILKDSGKPIGVTCGCYAKLHRQVAHIRRKK